MSQSAPPPCQRKGNGNQLRVITSSILTVAALLTISGCFPYSYSGYRDCTTVQCINKGLVDTTVIDTVKHDLAFSEFLSTIDSTSRSSELVSNLLMESAHELVSCLQPVIIQDTGRCRFVLIISPDGKTTVKHSTHRVDTSRIKEASEKASAALTRLPEVSGIWVTRGFELKGNTIIPDSANDYSKISGRSKASIMKVVMTYLKNLRYAYNRRLASGKEIKGRITVKFAIDHYGRVIFVKQLKSGVNDRLLKEAVVEQVASWKFEPILKPKDVTEVVYPFVFSH